MRRISGFEKLSKEMGHFATMVTLTCPSKYHNTFASSGDRNPKWDGSTPLDGQEYLNRTWKRIRAELHRLEIQPYGFRVAEPQHERRQADRSEGLGEGPDHGGGGGPGAGGDHARSAGLTSGHIRASGARSRARSEKRCRGGKQRT